LKKRTSKVGDRKKHYGKKRLHKIWKLIVAFSVVIGLIAGGLEIYRSLNPSPVVQNITVNIYYPPPNEPKLEPNIPNVLPKSPLEVGFYASPLFRGSEGRLHFNLTAIMRNIQASSVTIGWIYLEVVNVTYVDGTFETWNIWSNSTVSQSIGYGKVLYVAYGISEYGFEKEPKLVNLNIQVRVSDPENLRGKLSATVAVETKF
jgi:hypothetical protein